jgi:hypothetical protein
MPLERKRVWSLWRQIPGNLIPVLITAPFLVLAVQEITRFGVTTKAIGFSVMFVAFGWLAVNFIGLIGNSSLRKAVEMKFKDRYEYDSDHRYFVGFARPGKYGLLDPHEDLGFLVFRDTGLEFFGEVHQIELDWGSITKVGKRRNIHSWLGLGGWVSIEAVVGDKAVRLQVEPRVKGTHWGNARLRKSLVDEIVSKISV